MRTIEMHPAWEWDCEDCGTRNFATGLRASLDEEERRELFEQHGIDSNDPGEWLAMPEIVTCGLCKAKFETKRDNELEDDDD